MTIYSVDALRVKSQLAHASIQQAQEMGKVRFVKAMVDEAIVIDNQIDATLQEISAEGLPLSLRSYALSIRGDRP
jgi:hypothetical protein